MVHTTRGGINKMPGHKDPEFEVIRTDKGRAVLKIKGEKKEAPKKEKPVKKEVKEKPKAEIIKPELKEEPKKE